MESLLAFSNTCSLKSTSDSRVAGNRPPVASGMNDDIRTQPNKKDFVGMSRRGGIPCVQEGGLWLEFGVWKGS
jgi:hypothetical protein